MASEVEICNLALGLLGDESIISLSDDSKRAGLCKLFYPAIRDRVLRSHPWNSAIMRVVLAPLAETPAFGYSYYFVLPTDPYCLRVIEANENIYAWKIEGRKLLTDEAAVNLLYIGRVTDVNLFDSLLIDAIATRLAAELAHPLTAKMNTVTAMWELYKIKLQEARGVNAQEGTPPVLECTELTEVRY